MNHKMIAVIAMVCLWSSATGMAQQSQVKTTWVPFDNMTTPIVVDGVTYNLPAPVDGVLYEPVATSPKSRIAVVFYGTLKHPSGPELASRGYRVLLVQHSGFDNPIGYEGVAPSIAAGIKYLRGLPGIEKVILLGHSGTGALVDFYQNLAENGPRVCQGPEKIYPCDGKGLSGLPKADAVVTLDSHIGGGFANLTYMDPAITDDKHPRQRDQKVDMFDPKNGYDPKAGTYSESFTKAFFAAQAAANARRIQAALDSLKEIKAGNGFYKDDEPLIIPSGDGPGGARLLQADVRLVSHTKAPHPLIKADGTIVTQIVPSVRPPSARATGVGMYQPATSARRFLASSALRTTPEYGMTDSSITGIDWASSSTSAVTNVEGITVPILIMAMSCHYFLVPDEVIFDHARSKDKEYVLVEGASHVLTACRPEYGDTQKRVFDYVDTWLSAPGRFSPAHM